MSKPRTTGLGAAMKGVILSRPTKYVPPKLTKPPVKKLLKPKGKK